MMREKAAYYYGTLGKSCAEAILLAANDAYDLKLSQEAVQLFAGFRTGMGCGSTCGSLSGAMGVLSRMYGQREDFKDLCAAFVQAFEGKLACGTTDCEPIAAKYKTEAARCVAAVELGAEALQEFIRKLEGREKAPAQGCTLTPDQIKAAKGMGFLHQKGTNRFNARVITRNGRITAAEAHTIAEAARLYGDGHMMMTTRLTIEVSGVEHDSIPAFQAHLAQGGLRTGGTGSKVRPVVACKGTTCQYGLCDTYDLSQAIHEEFFVKYNGVSLPHKFKIAVGGCPNNCAKINLNDVGVMGARVPQYDIEACKGCKKCKVEEACPIQAAKLTDEKLVIDWTACNRCGRCVGKCPFHCIDASADGYKVFVGGRWGKKVAQGRPLEKIFPTREEALEVVDKAILLFRSEGVPGERFADTIQRIGFDRTQELLLGRELLDRKAEILGLDVVGGATC